MEGLSVVVTEDVSLAMEQTDSPPVERQASARSQGATNTDAVPHGSENGCIHMDAAVAEPCADASAPPTVAHLSAPNVASSAAATSAVTTNTYQAGMYSSGAQAPQTATFLGPDGSFPLPVETIPMLPAGYHQYSQQYDQAMSALPYAVGADGSFLVGAAGRGGMTAAGPNLLPNGQVPMYFNPSSFGYDQSGGGKDPRKGYPLVYPYVPLQKDRTIEKREKPLKKKTGCC
eukprot:GHVS01039935.1.p1 GENE.GHVS01039935.1~~GHVS01039935.1.p1  ORF type:complete len:231 (-),score=34.47 GHVS01039935.1:321-1013(-)